MSASPGLSSLLSTVEASGRPVGTGQWEVDLGGDLSPVVQDAITGF